MQVLWLGGLVMKTNPWCVCHVQETKESRSQYLDIKWPLAWLLTQLHGGSVEGRPMCIYAMFWFTWHCALANVVWCVIWIGTITGNSPVLVKDWQGWVRGNFPSHLNLLFLAHKECIQLQKGQWVEGAVSWSFESILGRSFWCSCSRMEQAPYYSTRS